MKLLSFTTLRVLVARMYTIYESVGPLFGAGTSLHPTEYSDVHLYLQEDSRAEAVKYLEVEESPSL